MMHHFFFCLWDWAAGCLEMSVLLGVGVLLELERRATRNAELELPASCCMLYFLAAPLQGNNIFRQKGS